MQSGGQSAAVPRFAWGPSSITGKKGAGTEIWPASIGLRGIAQTLPTRSFAEAGMRRSGQLRHPELRVNFFGPRIKMGVRSLTRNEPRDLHSGVRSGATV